MSSFEFQKFSFTTDIDIKIPLDDDDGLAQVT